jgi:hypothetical protein
MMRYRMVARRPIVPPIPEATSIVWIGEDDVAAVGRQALADLEQRGADARGAGTARVVRAA